jgi:putative zinc finger/helix-turn-helix YgiT family protein
MARDQREKMHRPGGVGRPFPWRCPNCRKKEVYRSPHPYEAEIKHDGRTYRLSLPNLQAPKCQACGEVLFDDVVDEQVNEALRAELGLLAPQDILYEARRLGLSQRELAKELGIAEETLSRWINGVQIQSRAMNNLMRMYFEKQESAPRVALSLSEHTVSAVVLRWQATFPNVEHMGEVVHYSQTVADRGQLLLLGS